MSTTATYKPEKVIPIPDKLRFNTDLSFGEKMFLAEIQYKSSQGDHIALSSRELSEIFGVSHQTILNWIRHLTNKKFIKVEYNHNDPKHLILKGTNKSFFK